jgi:hypothetical protein
MHRDASTVEFFVAPRAKSKRGCRQYLTIAEKNFE